jgi:hypothetical protein
MLEAIRDAIVGYVAPAFSSAHPSLSLVVDNSPFDWNSPPDRFVEMEVVFHDAAQIGPSASPRSRVRGTVYVCCHSRVGTGVKAGLALLDWFESTLAYRAIFGTGVVIQMREANPVGANSLKGWYHQEMKVYFYADPV